MRITSDAGSEGRLQKAAPRELDCGKRGSALLIALAFVVLLTGLILAFFSRSVLEEQVSAGSANQVKTDNFAMGALAATISDLKQEIQAGSAVPNYPVTGNYKIFYYTPLKNACMLPAVTGSTTGAAPGSSFTPASGTFSLGAGAYLNLIKISQYNQPIYPAGAPYTTPTGSTDVTRPPTTANQAVSTGIAADTTGAKTATTLDGTSLNGRYITGTRWNKPLLLPPIGTGTGTISAFPLPDWIYVSRIPPNVATPNPAKWNANLITSSATMSTTTPVVGRYAYAIYDEGGLLDINVAGMPTPLTSGNTPGLAVSGYKSALAMADLTQLPVYGTTTAALTQTQIDTIVGWRNNASATQSQGTSSTALSGSASAGYSWVAANATNYFFNIIANTGGFLRPMSAWSSVPTALTQTDQFFTSRQQLIQFFNQVLGGGTTVQNALQYLTHFSRDLNQPSYAQAAAKVTNAPMNWEANGGNDSGGLAPSTTTSAGNPGFDNTLNPPFLSQRVTTAFTRNDGSAAAVGDALVKKRFALMRLAWLTYQGPSAARNGVANSGTGTWSTSGDADNDMYLLENTYGIPQSYLAQGTAANIYKYFGLTWMADGRPSGSLGPGDGQMKWVYNHTSANPTGSTTTSPISTFPTHPASRNANGTAPYTTIYTLSQVSAAGREPDFVELLKAGICAGSLGKPATSATGTAGTPGPYQNAMDVSLDAHVIQIAANVIAQSNPACFAPRILFDDGNWTLSGQEYRGVEDFPYFFRFRSMHFPLLDSTPSESYAPKVGTWTNINGPFPGDIYPIVTSPANQNTALGNSGLAVLLAAPEIWNPHSWNTASATQGPRPTQFRLIAIDGPPTIAGPPSTADGNATTAVGRTRANLATNGTAYRTSSDTGVLTDLPAKITHQLSYTADSTALYFTIPTTRLDLFREPTMLFKPGVPQGSNLHFGGDPLGAATEGKNEVFNAALESAASPGESLLQTYLTANSSGYKGIKSLLASTDATYPGSGTPAYTDDKIYLGIYLGEFPVKWSDGTYIYTAASGGYSGNSNGLMTYRLQYQDPNNTANWITYDEKYGGMVNSNGGMNVNGNDNPATNYYPTNRNHQPDYIDHKLMSEGSDKSCEIYMDPRTSRFGVYDQGARYNGGTNGMTQWSSTYLAGAQNYGVLQGAMRDFRIDETNEDGIIYYPWIAPIVGWNMATTGNLPTETGVTGATTTTIYPGLLCQNNTQITSPQLQFFLDADGVVRRGMSAYVQPTATQPAVTRPGGITTATSPTGPSGIPTAVATDYSTASATTAASQVNSGMEVPSRPIMLNRPFRSVADMGYAFSGTPWRNIDFFTPESGGAPLLDVFCVNDTDDTNGLVAGKVNLNTRQPAVLQAILAGAYKNEFAPATGAIGATGTTTTATADNIAKALVTRTTDLVAADVTAGSGPLTNISELVGKYKGTNVAAPTITGNPIQGTDGSQTYVGFSGTQAPLTSGTIPTTPANLSSILAGDNASSGLPTNYAAANVERYREATIRALSNVGQTRVWNLMIDLIAQTGRFPASATTLANFNVEGEQRYWIHVSIDRLTGQVIDEQVEVVKE